MFISKFGKGIGSDDVAGWNGFLETQLILVFAYYIVFTVTIAHSFLTNLDLLVVIFIHNVNIIASVPTYCNLEFFK